MNKWQAILHTLKKNITEISALEFQGYEKQGGNYVFYRCKDCGYVSFSLAFLHGHAESHTSLLKTGDPEELMKHCEKIVVKEEDVVEIESMEGENL